MSRNLENIDPETDALNGMFKEHDQALLAIQRVRELHIKENENAEFCEECLSKYPCPTLKALDSEK